jgi:hypothetical protein
MVPQLLGITQRATGKSPIENADCQVEAFGMTGVYQSAFRLANLRGAFDPFDNALEFLRGLKAKTTGRYQLTSDGFAAWGHGAPQSCFLVIPADYSDGLNLRKARKT